MSNLAARRKKKKKEEKRKRIRSFFLNLGQQIEDLLKTGMKYIEMSLPVEKITNEYIMGLEDKLKRIKDHIEVRKANKEDINSIKIIYNAAWENSPMPFHPITEDKLLTIYNDKNTVFLIARMDNLDVGFMLLDYEKNEIKIGIIAGLGILPEYQRHGVGTLLGLESWYYFEKKGVDELRCEVHIDNQSSYTFIKGLGFEEYNEKIYRESDFLMK